MTDVQHESPRRHGRHRAAAAQRSRRGAGAVTGGIAAGSLALAAFATTSGSAAPDTTGLQASIARISPSVAADAVTALRTTAETGVGDVYAEARTLREAQAEDAMDLSSQLVGDSSSQLRSAAKEVAQEKKAAKEKAERAAKEKAERAAWEKAERAAAERAEREAAEEAEREAQAAAEKAERAAEARAEEQSSRSARRSSSTPAAPAATQAPAAAPVATGDPRSIAQSMLGSHGWGSDQWGCLDALWQKESGWNHRAMNASSGAYGIPQSLPGSKMASAGADWQTNPATQIAWGLGYIAERYGSPCSAWAHSQAVNWY